MLYYIIEEEKLILFCCSKCSSSTIRNIIAKYYKLNGKKNIRLNLQTDWINLLDNKLTYIDKNKEYYKYEKYLITRDPYTRIVSGFIDKFVYQKWEKYGCKNFYQFVMNLSKNVDNNILLFNNIITRPNNIKADEFELITNKTTFKTTLSFYQYLNSTFDRVLYNDNTNIIANRLGVYEYENKNVKIKGINKSLSVPLYDIEINNLQIIFKDGKPDYKLFYNNKLISKINELYKEDFDFLASLGIYCKINDIVNFHKIKF